MISFYAQLLACALPLLVTLLFMHRVREQLAALALDLEEVSAHTAQQARALCDLESLKAAQSSLDAAVKEFTDMRSWTADTMHSRQQEILSLGKSVDILARTLNSALQPEGDAPKISEANEATATTVN